MLNFLKSLQKLDPIVNNVSDTLFRSLVLFPYLELKNQNKDWIINLVITEELYFNYYPCLFTSCFVVYENKYDLRVKLKLIQIVSIVNNKQKSKT
jgi:hypothetical protein